MLGRTREQGQKIDEETVHWLRQYGVTGHLAEEPGGTPAPSTTKEDTLMRNLLIVFERLIEIGGQ